MNSSTLRGLVAPGASPADAPLMPAWWDWEKHLQVGRRPVVLPAVRRLRQNSHLSVSQQVS